MHRTAHPFRRARPQPPAQTWRRFIFPAEAVEHNGEAPPFLFIGRISNTPDCILQTGGNHSQIFHIQSGQFQRFLHVSSNDLVPDTADIGATGAELGLNPLIAAIQMIYPIDGGFILRRQAGYHQRDRGA